MDKIIERIPEGMLLKLQTYSNEILDLSEDIEKLEIINHNLKLDIQDREKLELKHQREIISLNKQLKRTQRDFNHSESKYFKTKNRLEESLKIS